MLFNSYSFIFLFLPVTLIVYSRLRGGKHHDLGIAWLVAASLFFYGWWNPAYLFLIAGSIVMNFGLGAALMKTSGRAGIREKIILYSGIAVNLAVLGYFKYANFFISSINPAFNTSFQLASVGLPLGISFFTFQQITFLIDTYWGKIRENNFLYYSLFVVFFPQLIAGPIVQHREMMPQFVQKSQPRPNSENLSGGLTMFSLGLFKKVILADGISQYSTPVFDAASAGNLLTFYEAWSGVLSYSFQLYFDFSGYSDMAIGLACMFGVRLPANFNSPYKAKNIIEFWRRWHMTLGRFLRQYLYIPLGGNRGGPLRQGANIMVTLLLGGLWHGAGWTYVLWGGLHGLFLVLNHGWRKIQRTAGRISGDRAGYGIFFSQAFTFLMVTVAWVLFRSDDLETAGSMYQSMIGWNGDVPDNSLRLAKGRLILLGLIVWGLPNTQQVLSRYQPVLETDAEDAPRWWNWRPAWYWAAVTAVISLVSVLGLTQPSEFLYFQF